MSSQPPRSERPVSRRERVAQLTSEVLAECLRPEAASDPRVIELRACLAEFWASRDATAADHIRRLQKTGSPARRQVAHQHFIQRQRDSPADE